ncbi:F-box family protein [Striga asiatica]|uniref:F-box family protein n=1 Tax=Striga asiatica TaxID=4170 RepID=A0A5A7R6E0_STRAF|nr:F-box family protein [Striga asiatica]
MANKAPNSPDPGPQTPKPDPPAPLFPPGVTVEILSRLPIKDAARLQLVSKHWQSLIQNHYFMNRHMAHTRFTYHWFNIQPTQAQAQTARETYLLTAGLDGLLILKNTTKNIHYLWNPATKRALELPSPHEGSYGLSLAFVRATQSYRVVSFYLDPKTGFDGCEILTPGLPGPWKPLNVPGALRKRERISVIVSGEAVHCVFFNRARPETLISLNLETEKFSISCFGKLGRPDTRWRNYWDMDWAGKLAIADVVGPNLEVMELTDYERGIWCREKRIVGLPFFKEGNNDEFVPLFAREGKIWFWMKGSKIFTYDMETGEMKDVREAPNLAASTKVYPYKPSLIGFQGMVPDTMLERYRARLMLC